MNQKLLGWIELLVAAAFTGALNASANALAAPDIFTHGNVASILGRMAAVGAVLSMRDQMKQSPVPQLFIPNESPKPAAPAQEELPNVTSGHTPAGS
jgi:hypothetical protein